MTYETAAALLKRRCAPADGAPAAHVVVDLPADALTPPAGGGAPDGPGWVVLLPGFAYARRRRGDDALELLAVVCAEPGATLGVRSAVVDAVELWRIASASSGPEDLYAWLETWVPQAVAASPDAHLATLAWASQVDAVRERFLRTLKRTGSGPSPEVDAWVAYRERPARSVLELRAEGRGRERKAAAAIAFAAGLGAGAQARSCGGCQEPWRAGLTAAFAQLGMRADELERRSDARFQEEQGW